MVETSVLDTLTKLFKHRPHIQKGGEELMFFCPSCNHYKRKLNINTNYGYYHCWVCNFSGKSYKSLLSKIKAPSEFYEVLCNIKVSKTQNHNEVKKLFLPYEFKPLYKPSSEVAYKHAVSYCMGRGLTVYDMVRYNIGYCTEGQFQNRVVVPSYNSMGELNFYCGRDYHNSKIKYRLCESTKNIVGFEMMSDFSKPITLVEGVFDAFSVKYNAVPLFGKTLSSKLKIKLMTQKPPRVNVLLDNDAIKSSLDICTFLIQNQIDAHLVLLDGKDPNEIGHIKTWQNIDASVKMDETTLFKMKMKLKHNL